MGLYMTAALEELLQRGGDLDEPGAVEAALGMAVQKGRDALDQQAKPSPMDGDADYDSDSDSGEVDPRMIALEAQAILWDVSLGKVKEAMLEA